MSQGNEVLPGHVTNERVRANIQQAIGRHEDLTIVKRRKLQWYCLVSRSSGLAKTILDSSTRQTEEEMRRQHQGMDSLEFAKSQRTVQNLSLIHI